MKKIFTAGLLFSFLFAATGFLACPDSVRAESDSIQISEVLINGPGGKEFVEIHNPTGNMVDVSGWVLNYYSKDRDWLSPYRKKFFPANSLLGPGEFFLISIKAGDYAEESAWNLGYSGYQLGNSDGAIAIFPDENFSEQNAADALGWGAAKVRFFEGISAPADKSLEKPDLSGNNEKENWRESCEEGGTPGENPETCRIDPGPPIGDGDPGDGGGDASETPAACAASSANVKMNEILPYPGNGDEFIEIKNTGTDCVNVSGWKLMDEAGHKKEFPENSILDPGEYAFLEGNLYLNNNSDTVYLLPATGSVKSEALDSIHYEQAPKNFSFSLEGGNWHWTSTLTPGDKNVITEPDSGETNSADFGNDANLSSAENIYLNEIFPDPKEDSDEEYIEIANGESGAVDLLGWRLKDASKSKGYEFKEHVSIEPGEYLAICKSESKIALNNSGESVYLYNPKGEAVSSATFDKSSKGASYNFDGKNWRWSKYLTPGKKNKLDSEPSVKIKKPKNVFKDIFAEFSAKAKDKETKKLEYAWDFGDGKKSRLAKTSHKYQGTGKYTVTLTVSDESQMVEKNFIISVKNSPRPDLEIVKLVPNPAGNDAKGEIVEIKNGTSKKISLNGWKIATGSGEKMYNHPISGGVILNAGETKTITREMSKFSLNNKSGKAQLVSPDGKIADVVEYAKDPPDSLRRTSERAGKIAEGEAYTKINDEWQWSAPDTQENNEEDEGNDVENQLDDEANEESEESDSGKEGEVLGATEENRLYSDPPETGYTSEDEFIFLKLFGFLEYKPHEADFCPVAQPANTLASF